MGMENDFLSIKEFASKLRVHPNTIRRAIKNGRINALRLSSTKKSTYRIARTEIDRIALFDMEEMIDKIVEKRMKENHKVL